MKKVLIFLFSVGAVFSAYSYDDFDVKICQATQPASERLNCFRRLQKDPNVCRENTIEAELVCRESLAKNKIRASPEKTDSAKITSADLSMGQICKAVIAALMGRKPSGVQVVQDFGEVVVTSYVRDSDRTQWSNKCSVKGNSVRWGVQGGRWRDEDVVSISRNDHNRTLHVIQRYPDGSRSEKQFPYDELTGR